MDLFKDFGWTKEEVLDRLSQAQEQTEGQLSDDLQQITALVAMIIKSAGYIK